MLPDNYTYCLELIEVMLRLYPRRKKIYFIKIFNEAAKQIPASDDIYLMLKDTIEALNVKIFEPYNSKLDIWKNDLTLYKSLYGNEFEPTKEYSIIDLAKEMGYYRESFTLTHFDVYFYELCIESAYKNFKKTKHYFYDTSEQYIDGYTTRLNEFITNYEGLESEFIQDEIKYFKTCFSEAQQIATRQDITDIHNVSWMDNWNYEHFKYAANRKIDYLESKLLLKKTLPATVTQNQDESELKNFKDLFIYPDLLPGCLKLLIEAGAINDSYHFIGKNKGVLIIWLNALEVRSMFKIHLGNDNNKEKILINNFKHFTITSGAFRQKNSRATEEFKTHFEQEINILNSNRANRINKV